MPRDEDRVADIVIAARFLGAWLEGRDASSLNDRMLLSAVIRELSIIGEAANHLSRS